MPIDYEKLMGHSIPEGAQSYTERDVMLYALSLGLGLDPRAEDQLRFTFEGGGLAVLPTFALVLAHSGPWMANPATGITFSGVVHADQHLELLAPLTSSGRVTTASKVEEVIDKGEGRGAIVITSRNLIDANGTTLARMRQSSFCRADGGFGGPPGNRAIRQPLPDRPADAQWVHASSPQAALLYRLLGDLNPLHASPNAAERAGFERPILHGLATFGMAAYSVLAAVMNNDPSRMRRIGCRFVAPALPGDSFRTDIWRADEGFMFQTVSLRTGTVVLGSGYAS